MGIGKARGFVADDHVGSERQFQSARIASAFHHCDDRLAQPGQSLDRQNFLPQPAELIGVGWLLQIVACGEVAARTAQDNQSNRLLAVDIIDVLAKFTEELPIDCIALVRTIEHERCASGNIVADDQRLRYVRHDASLPARARWSTDDLLGAIVGDLDL